MKKNVQLIVSALKSYGVQHIVLSPGARNAPLIHSITQDSYFKCHLVIDERSAAFFALGIIQKQRWAVAVCCTSGTALLNYAPAIAEAFYQELPLVVISADRTNAWIGQMDGQTIPQNNVFGSLVKKTVSLPEINTDEDDWHCRRMINEALLACNKHGLGPVHINVPISEPLFDFSEKNLPSFTPISYVTSTEANLSNYIENWKKYRKRMIVIGQFYQNNSISNLIDKLSEKFDFIVLAEHLANLHTDPLVSNFDPLIHSFDKSETEAYSPDLLITFGGHLVSKRLKQFLRQNKPVAHWHLSESKQLTDLFQSLTDWIDSTPEPLLSALSDTEHQKEKISYSSLWLNKSQSIPSPAYLSYYSDLFVVQHFIESLPAGAALHLANSSPVRNAQFYSLDNSAQVFCNRGTNGIDGALSTAVGFAHVHKGLVFIIIGDLSFFYDLNILCFNNLPSNMRILLINNGGGNLFNQLPGLEKSNALKQYIFAAHSEKAGKWISKEKATYLSANNKEEVEKNMTQFVCKESDKAIIFEVFTSAEKNTTAIKEYYNNLKK